jgi:hypothetical protein
VNKKELAKAFYGWYVANGKPNREALRNGSVELPSGMSSRFVENLIPLLKELDKEGYDPEELPESISDIPKVKIIASDFHIPFHDREVTELFLKLCGKVNPDEVILNGNVNDCMAFSDHPRIRELQSVFRNGKDEREMWFKFADGLRKILPATKITYIGSQCHEGRINKWVETNPILQDDENYTIEGWFKLKDYDIDFIPEVYDPINEIDLSEVEVLPKETKLTISHGTVARNKSGASAMVEMEYTGCSTVTAHTHRLSQVYKTDMRGTRVAVECGCACRRKPWYELKGKRRLLDWQQGFVILVTQPDGTFNLSLVPVLRDENDEPFLLIGSVFIK